MERYVRTMAFSFFFLFFNSTFISRALFLNFLPTLFTNFREFQCIKINCVFHMEYSFSWKKTFRLVITSLQRGNGWNENRIPLRGISHTSGFYNLAMISGYSFEFCRVKSPFRFFPREKRGKLIDFGYIRLKYIVCQRIDSKSRGNLQPRINLHLEILVGGMVVQTVVCGLTELRIRDCSP